MKRVFLCLMVLLLAFDILPMPIYAESEGTDMAGSGSAEDPFIITGLDQLNAMRNNLSAHYRLAADIDASDTANWDGGAGWKPIGERGNGDKSEQFTGEFDGAGYVIRNLTINRPSEQGVGLFGMIGTGGVVRNLGIEGGSVIGSNFTGALAGNNNGTVERAHSSVDVTGYGVVGGLVGYDYGHIISSYATGNVSGNSAVGGLAGRSDRTITESYATGNVVGDNDVGGLVGLLFGGNLTRSYFSGKVMARGYYIGGLVGNLDGGDVSQSYNIGSVSGDRVAGGLVGISVYGHIGKTYTSGTVTTASGDVGGVLGANNGAMMENNYWDSETSGQSSGCSYNNDDYGVECVVTKLTTAQALGQASYTGFDFDADWFMVDGSTRPFLRSEWSQTISNVHQLQLMAMDPTANYTLADNIDFGNLFKDDNRADMWGTSDDQGAGFAPVGDSVLRAFTGRLDGQGYAVRGLIINRPDTGQVGLIGYLGDGGLVRSIGVDGGSVRGGYSSGGLVGDIGGGTVELSYSSADVSGIDNVGGLVGKMLPGVVKQSYATGAVTGTYAVGGLVGRADLGSLVEDTYATGSVEGKAEVGGLVGRHVGTINRAYAAGRVSGSGSEVGGLVGRDFSPTSIVTSGYYDAAATGHGGGQTTASLKRKSTFESWDFSGYWTIEEGKTYPFLQGIKANIGRDAAPPAVVNIRIEQPDSILLTFDEEVNLLSAGGFSVLADGVDVTVVDTIKAGAKTMKLTVGEPLRSGQDIRLSYDSQAGSIVDLANNPLPSVSDQPWPPNIEVTMTTADGSDYQDGTWTNQPVSVSASVYEGTAEVNEFAYSLDGGETWSPYTTSIELQDDGVHVLDFKAADAAGMETAERRTVKIGSSGLALTPTMVKSDGGTYAEGEWTNQSVTVSVYAEGGTGGIASFTYTLDGGSPQAYTNSSPIEITEDGDHAIVFQAEDEAGHQLSDVLKVKIDRTPPAIAFSPNGRESVASSATSRTTAMDTGSGIDHSTLQYAWTTDLSAPAEGWAPFASGTDLTKSGTTGDWYLHVRASDRVGNSTEAVSNRFRLGQESSSSAPLPANTNLDGLNCGAASVVGLKGGVVKFEGGEISFPACALDRPFQVTVNKITGTDTLPLSDHEHLTSRVFEMKKDVPGNFLVNVTVKLRLNADVTRQDGDQILLCWLNEDTRQWVPLGDPQIDFENGMVSGTINHLGKFAAIARTVVNNESAAVFTDIRGHWAEETIQHLAGSGIVKGYPDGTFRPNRPITRAEFVSILTAVLQWKPKADKVFIDTENHWARAAISTAYANGMIRGYDSNTFVPDQPITREQMAVMAANALHLENTKSTPSFTDGDRISQWAKNAVASAVERGILTGYPDRTVKPQVQATRAEAVTVIKKIISIIEDK
ncbi:S-layer homology domain-containing protein [Paenibacillus sp. OAE614]|uniref:S-layer homology domain-containing protein n=1 Tax=Paenibacillus sp. OAE614 TaxID=2663804 RepID=UPI00178B2C91